MSSTAVAFLYLIIWTVVSCVFGFITKTMNEKKGYTGGFAWGFWLGWIGMIVVAVKPDIKSQRSYSNNNVNIQAQTVQVSKPESKADERKKLLQTLENLHKDGVLSDDEFEKKTIELRLGKEDYKKIEGLDAVLKQGIIDQETYDLKKAEIISAFLAKEDAKKRCREYKTLMNNGTITRDEYLEKCKEIMGNDFGILENVLHDAMQLGNSTEIYNFVKENGIVDSSDFQLLLKKLQSQANRERTYGNTKAETCVMLEGFMENGNMFARIDKNATGDITCPICGERQPAYMSKCRSCKVPFAGFNE